MTLVSRIRFVEHANRNRARHCACALLVRHWLPADTAGGTEESQPAKPRSAARPPHRPRRRALHDRRPSSCAICHRTSTPSSRRRSVVLDCEVEQRRRRCAGHLRHASPAPKTDRSTASPTPTHNGRFRSLGVRPGDVLKYYVLYDEDSAETGISQTVSHGSHRRPGARRQLAAGRRRAEIGRSPNRPRSKSGATATSGSTTSPAPSPLTSAIASRCSIGSRAPTTACSSK